MNLYCSVSGIRTQEASEPRRKDKVSTKAKDKERSKSETVLTKLCSSPEKVLQRNRPSDSVDYSVAWQQTDKKELENEAYSIRDRDFLP